MLQMSLLRQQARLRMPARLPAQQMRLRRRQAQLWMLQRWLRRPQVRLPLLQTRPQRHSLQQQRQPSMSQTQQWSWRQMCLQDWLLRLTQRLLRTERPCGGPRW